MDILIEDFRLDCQLGEWQSDLSSHISTALRSVVATW